MGYNQFSKIIPIEIVPDKRAESFAKSLDIIGSKIEKNYGEIQSYLSNYNSVDFIRDEDDKYYQNKYNTVVKEINATNYDLLNPSAIYQIKSKVGEIVNDDVIRNGMASTKNLQNVNTQWAEAFKNPKFINKENNRNYQLDLLKQQDYISGKTSTYSQSNATFYGGDYEQLDEALEKLKIKTTDIQNLDEKSMFVSMQTSRTRSDIEGTVDNTLSGSAQFRNDWDYYKRTSPQNHNAATYEKSLTGLKKNLIMQHEQLQKRKALIDAGSIALNPVLQEEAQRIENKVRNINELLNTENKDDAYLERIGQFAFTENFKQGKIAQFEEKSINVEVNKAAMWYSEQQYKRAKDAQDSNQWEREFSHKQQKDRAELILDQQALDIENGKAVSGMTGLMADGSTIVEQDIVLDEEDTSPFDIYQKQSSLERNSLVQATKTLISDLHEDLTTTQINALEKSASDKGINLKDLKGNISSGQVNSLIVFMEAFQGKSSQVLNPIMGKYIQRLSQLKEQTAVFEIQEESYRDLMKKTAKAIGYDFDENYDKNASVWDNVKDFFRDNDNEKFRDAFNTEYEKRVGTLNQLYVHSGKSIHLGINRILEDNTKETKNTKIKLDTVFQNIRLITDGQNNSYSVNGSSIKDAEGDISDSQFFNNFDIGKVDFGNYNPQTNTISFRYRNNSYGKKDEETTDAQYIEKGKTFYMKLTPKQATQVLEATGKTADVNKLVNVGRTLDNMIDAQSLDQSAIVRLKQKEFFLHSSEIGIPEQWALKYKIIKANPKDKAIQFQVGMKNYKMNVESIDNFKMICKNLYNQIKAAYASQGQVISGVELIKVFNNKLVNLDITQDLN